MRLTVAINKLFFRSSELDLSFEKELLKSEIIRTKILFWFFFIGAVLFSVQVSLIRKSFLEFLPDDDFPYWVPAVYFFANALYARLLWLYFQRKVNEGKKVHKGILYLSGFIESSIPTCALLFFSLNYPVPVLVFATPPEFVYFIFLILATLRLNEKLAVFIGFVSFFEFNILAYYLLSITPKEKLDPLLAGQFIYFAKSNILLISGLISAFVARQIKSAIQSTLGAEKEKIQIRHIFGQHVSPAVVNRLLEQTEEREGEIRHVCILFFDIRNFTSLSEQMDVKALIRFLNQVFTESIESVNAHNGIINKFLGDGFMAVFGAPLSEGEDVLNAVKSSLDIRNRLNRLIKNEHIQNFNFGIGLHCGEAITGNVGSSERKEYTVIGDVVNVASRIEQMNKELSSQILASEEVITFLKDIPIKNRGEVFLKGKTQSKVLYQLGDAF